jgi:ferredoxin-type protein NapH
MLSITSYLGFLVVLISVGGLFYPLLGFFLPVVFATLIVSGVFGGRWFCGNLCPRGSFNDFWLSRISRNKRIPKAFRSLYVRVPVFIALMGFMAHRIIQTEGVLERVGMVFVTMCALTTAAAIFLGAVYSPRAWCSLCPMGTLQRFLGAHKKGIAFDFRKCIKCGICEKACPMQLKPDKKDNEPDCIRCGRCMKACPKNALKT